MRPLPRALATLTVPAAMASTRPAHAEEGVGAEFERVAEGVVDAAEDDVDAARVRRRF